VPDDDTVGHRPQRSAVWVAEACRVTTAVRDGDRIKPPAPGLPLDFSAERPPVGAMDSQDIVAEFLTTHDLHVDPTYRLLDLSAEVGELAADATDATDYGAAPEDLDLSRDELGDALFALLALAEGTDTDAGIALAESLAKYETRIEAAGAPGSANDS
jgi:NTP pyrophosphatase (non-canonical NTP hydrolase)